MNDKIEQLIAIHEIRQVHLDYCKGIDRMDWELIEACYHPDGYDDHGPFKGDVKSFVAWLKLLLPTYASTTHFVGNQSVDVDGNYAWAEHYTRALHRIRATDNSPSIDWVLNVRYIDRMEKRAGVWKIAHRTLACDNDRFDPVLECTEGDWGLATRDRSDPSYDRLRIMPQPILIPEGLMSGEDMRKPR